MTEIKPDSSTQAKAEAIVVDALARHGHAVPEPGRHLRRQIVTAPGVGAREVAEGRRAPSTLEER